MDTKLIKQKILDLAIRGKLVPQNPADEPASVLLERIKAEKAQLIKEGKIKKEKPFPPIEEIPFEIPESWEWCRLGEICSKLTDGSHNPPPKTECGFTVISAQNIKNGEIVYTAHDRYCSADGFIKENPRTNISKGDIILGIIGGSIGNAAIYQLDDKVIAQRSIAIINTFIDNKFCFNLLKSQIFQQLFIIKSNGNAQAGIYLGELSQMAIPIPPLEEQKRIVAEIDRWFKWIDELDQNQQDLHTAIKQAKSKILDLAIHGKLVPQESKWKEYELKEVCDFLSGYAFDSNEYKTSGIPLVRISNIKNSGIDLEQCVFIQKSIEDRFIIKKGDLLIAMSGATTGKMGIYRLDSEAALNQRVGNLRVKDTSLLLPEYRDLYMLAQQELILKLAYGGAQPNISAKNISSFKISLPTIVEQKKIIIKTQSLFAQLDCIEKCLG